MVYANTGHTLNEEILISQSVLSVHKHANGHEGCARETTEKPHTLTTETDKSGRHEPTATYCQVHMEKTFYNSAA